MPQIVWAARQGRGNLTRRQAELAGALPCAAVRGRVQEPASFTAEQASVTGYAVVGNVGAQDCGQLRRYRCQ